MKINGIEYSGQFEGGLTYTIAAGAVAGDAVTQTAAGTAGRGAAGGVLLGKLVTPEPDGRGTVMNRGIIIVRAGTGLAVGYVLAVVDGAGAVTPPAAGAAGRPAWVIGIVDGMAIIDLI